MRKFVAEFLTSYGVLLASDGPEQDNEGGAAGG